MIYKLTERTNAIAKINNINSQYSFKRFSLNAEINTDLCRPNNQFSLPHARYKNS